MFYCRNCKLWHRDMVACCNAPNQQYMLQSIEGYKLIGSAGKSANSVQIYEEPDTMPYEKRWFKKKTQTKQEALIEVATSEIYRYIIGDLQPEFRLHGNSSVVCKFANFVPPRAIFDKISIKYNKDKISNWRRSFIRHLDSFVNIIVASMFLAENDLSDNNYGPVFKSWDNKNVIESDHGNSSFLEANSLEPDACLGFIKIDHGQSLNELRIENAGILKNYFFKNATIKFFTPRDSETYDTRAKENRDTKFFTMGSRRYKITGEYVKNMFSDFINKKYNLEYIRRLDFQPSIFPLYDSRLLNNVLLNESNIDKEKLIKDLDLYKMQTIFFIINTADKFYYDLLKNALPWNEMGAIGLLEKIYKVIISRKEELSNAAKACPEYTNSTIKLQALYRMHITRKKFVQKKEAITKLSNFAANKIKAQKQDIIDKIKHQAAKNKESMQLKEGIKKLHNFTENKVKKTDFNKINSFYHVKNKESMQQQNELIHFINYVKEQSSFWYSNIGSNRKEKALQKIIEFFWEKTNKTEYVDKNAIIEALQDTIAIALVPRGETTCQQKIDKIKNLKKTKTGKACLRAVNDKIKYPNLCSIISERSPINTYNDLITFANIDDFHDLYIFKGKYYTKFNKV